MPVRYPIFEQQTITDAMLDVILAHPYKDANDYDINAVKALIPLLDVRQCWLVMEWLN